MPKLHGRGEGEGGRGEGKKRVGSGKTCICVWDKEELNSQEMYQGIDRGDN